jgi:hypothetical protein
VCAHKFYGFLCCHKSATILRRLTTRLSDGAWVNVKRSGFSKIIDPLFGLLKTPPAIARTDCSAPRSHKKDEGGPDKNSKNKP